MQTSQKVCKKHCNPTAKRGKIKAEFPCMEMGNFKDKRTFLKPREIMRQQEDEKMDLQKKQLADKNRSALCGILMICGSVLLITLLSFLNGGGIPQMIRLIVVLATLGFNIAAYAKYKEDGVFVHCSCISITIFFVVVMFTVTIPEMYAVIYPIAIFVMTFSNKKLIKLGTVSGLVVLIISHLLLMKQGYVDATQFVTELLFTITACVLANIVTSLNIRQSSETIDAIKSGADAQAETSDEIIKLATALNERFEIANEVSSNLNTAMNSTHLSVSEIAESTKTTAESVEQQTSQTSDIQNSIQEVGEEANAIGEISERTGAAVDEGVALIEKLKLQAVEVAKINTETKATTEALNDSIKDVQAITETILGISSQTNLLALNASIEAARAGEAGKGFAVVADEIRTLSEGTRQATEQISEIISRLTKDAQTAANSMMKSAEYAQKQNTLIEETGNKLGDIKTETDELHRGVVQVNAAVSSVINANTKIMDSITNLSAVSEEVAASTESVMSQSETTMDALNSMNTVLHEINDIAVHMEQVAK